MTPFLVFDDDTGSFVNVEDIQGCIATADGSVVLLRDNPATVQTGLTPREILRRTSIIRFKRGLDDAEAEAQSRAAATAAAPRRGTKDRG